MENRSIALDGPSGAGKSTLAKMTAKHFGLIYVDTGALYRCIGLFTLRSNVDTHDEGAVTALLPQIKIEMYYDDDNTQRMVLNGEDVTDKIRTPEASMAASDVSALPNVRAFLLSMQRDMSEKYDVIMDGRDIGTVILPNAGTKIFLTALPETRAARRHLELLEKDPAILYEDVLSDINKRDANDSSRSAAPLKAADDAIILDTTELDLDDSFRKICEIISGKMKEA